MSVPPPPPPQTVYVAVANGGESPRSRAAALILAILLGGLGIHRFYVGKIGTGILWLLTGGLLGIGWIVDIIMIAVGSFRDKEGRVVARW